MARVLSAHELGADRYAAAAAARRWPTEFRYREGASGAPFRGTHAPQLTATPRPPAPPVRAAFARAAPAEWRALATLPAGPAAYAVALDGATVAEGTVDVSPPPPPSAAEEGAAAALAARPPSGAVQRGGKGGGKDGGGGNTANGKPARWPVEFVYAEPADGVAEVHLELPATEETVRCVRRRDPDAPDAPEVWSAEVGVAAGDCDFRFVVVFDEAIAPDRAPLTRLGFDPCTPAPARNSLTTWPLTVRVVDRDEEGREADAGAGPSADSPQAVDAAVDGAEAGLGAALGAVAKQVAALEQAAGRDERGDGGGAGAEEAAVPGGLVAKEVAVLEEATAGTDAVKEGNGKRAPDAEESGNGSVGPEAAGAVAKEVATLEEAAKSASRQGALAVAKKKDPVLAEASAGKQSGGVATQDATEAADAETTPSASKKLGAHPPLVATVVGLSTAALALALFLAASAGSRGGEGAGYESDDEADWVDSRPGPVLDGGSGYAVYAMSQSL